MKVTVFGTGYVGLTQAVCLAEVGHTVCCVDINEERVARLNEGHSPIYEPGLAPLITKNLAAKRLQFTTDAAYGVGFAEQIFIAVGNPPNDVGSAHQRHVFAVVDTIASHSQRAKLVVNKSTSPIGTVDRIRARLHEAAAGKPWANDFQVASNPEFLKEGCAVDDCMRPERIIIGTDNQDVVGVLRELYQPFSRNHEKIMVMDARSAELTKYAANCMLATKISFINEIANLAEKLGADIEMVRRGIGSDSRIGYHFIYPGCGFGGSCFPKDIQALQHIARGLGYQPRLLQAVEEVNDAQKHRLFEKISAHYRGDLAGKTFALWGLAFKPNTDDMRDAPSRVLLAALWAAGAKVRAFDPEAMDEARHIFGARDDLTLVASKEEALEGADALLIVTEWQDFRVLDTELVKAKVADRVIFDGRNLFEPARLAAEGLAYYGIGRGRSLEAQA